MNRIIRNTGFYLLIFLVTVGIVQFISSQNDNTTKISYSCSNSSFKPTIFRS